jgi:hypothetical protein
VSGQRDKKSGKRDNDGFHDPPPKLSAFSPQHKSNVIARRPSADEAIHMWTAPGLQGRRAVVLDRIACVHMSGLLDAIGI